MALAYLGLSRYDRSFDCASQAFIGPDAQRIPTHRVRVADLPLIALPDHPASPAATTTRPTDGLWIVTSLMPKRIADQQTAVQSWHDSGCQVCSVNSAAEVAMIRDQFPTVRFIDTDHFYHDAKGRYLTKLDGLLKAIPLLDADIVGIVNSDIILDLNADRQAFIRNIDSNTVIISPRIDINAPDERKGNIFHEGYDVFFFRTHLTDRFTDTAFALGMPWWDYWIPAKAISDGLNVFTMADEFAFHVVHPFGYAEADFISYCREIILKLSDGCASDRDDNTGPDCDLSFGYVKALSQAVVDNGAVDTFDNSMMSGRYARLLNFFIKAMAKPRTSDQSLLETMSSRPIESGALFLS